MENKAFLQKYAMRFGTYMGLFWIAKFFLFPLGLEMPVLQWIFLSLTIYVPILGYKFAKKYRDTLCGGAISFFHAWLFVTFMYLFASLLTSVGHYVYFQFIDNGYIASTYLGMIKNAGKELNGADDLLKQLEEAVNLFAGLRPIEIIMQLLSQNMLYCSVIAIPTALILKKKEVKTVSKEFHDNIEDNKE